MILDEQIDMTSNFYCITKAVSFDTSSSIVGTDTYYKLTLNNTEYTVVRASISGTDKSEFSYRNDEGDYLITLTSNDFSESVELTSHVHVVLSKMNGDQIFEFEGPVESNTYFEFQQKIPFVVGETCHVEIGDDSYDMLVTNYDGETGLFYTSFDDKYLIIANYEDDPTYVATNIEKYFQNNLPLKINKTTIVPISDKYVPQLGGAQFRIEDGSLLASLDGGTTWQEVTLS